MKRNKTCLTLGIVLAVTFSVFEKAAAQNDPAYTHFMFNKMAYNPAFAGNDQVMKLVTIYRKQWAGIEGAPTTINLHGHMPFAKDRCGIGLSITSEKIGYFNTTFAELAYAYRIPLGKNYLVFGLNGRMERGVSDQSKALVNDTNDNMVMDDPVESFSPNFGAGVLFSGSNFFVGFSRPQLLQNSNYRNLELDGISEFRLRTNYIMGGLTLPLSPKVKFLPTMLVSYQPNAPTSVDVNLGFTFFDALFTGLSYRLDDSADLLIGYQITPQFRMGAAYDFTLSELNAATTGSFELTLQYLFRYQDGGVQNLRFF